MFGVDVHKLIRQICAEITTYGKAKIFVILKSDFGVEISESSVGRIIKKLRFLGSKSTLRCRRKRDKYAKPLKFKQYDEKNRPHDCDEKWRRNEAFRWH